MAKKMVSVVVDEERWNVLIQANERLDAVESRQDNLQEQVSEVQDGLVELACIMSEGE